VNLRPHDLPDAEKMRAAARLVVVWYWQRGVDSPSEKLRDYWQARAWRVAFEAARESHGR
jgi:hypothetical protein